MSSGPARQASPWRAARPACWMAPSPASAAPAGQAGSRSTSAIPACLSRWTTSSMRRATAGSTGTSSPQRGETAMVSREGSSSRMSTGTECGSSGSGPAMTAKARAASATLRTMGQWQEMPKKGSSKPGP